MQIYDENDKEFALAVYSLEDRDFDLEQFLNKQITISVRVPFAMDENGVNVAEKWMENDKRYDIQYTPTQIYQEKVVEVDQEFIYKEKTVVIDKIITNGLYTQIIATYDKEIEFNQDSDSNYDYPACVFLLEDESGDELELITFQTDFQSQKPASMEFGEGDEIVLITEGIATTVCFYEKLGEDSSKIYIKPVTLTFANAKGKSHKMTKIGDVIEVKLK